jgi:hypothetical protein
MFFRRSVMRGVVEALADAGRRIDGVAVLAREHGVEMRVMSDL